MSKDKDRNIDEAMEPYDSAPQFSRTYIREENAEIERYSHQHDITMLYTDDASALLGRARDTTPFLVDGVIPEQGLCIIAGHPEAKKSWLIYQMALNVARGEPWFYFDVPKPQNVLVMSYDNPDHELARRFKLLGLREDDKSIRFHSLKPPPKKGYPAMLRIPDARHAILQILEYHKPGLVVIDSMRQAHTAEERDSSSMMLVMSYYREMTAMGAAVVIIHHFRKAAASKRDRTDDEMRGSSEILASADMSAHVGSGTFEIQKTRGWDPKPDQRKFAFTVEDYEDENGGKRVRLSETETIHGVHWLIKRKGPQGREQIATELGISIEAARQLVRKGITEGSLREVRRGTASGEKAARLIELTPAFAEKMVGKKETDAT